MKRYVLLGKIIIDRDKPQEDGVEYDIRHIKLQSDNLIDLAEVGDMVEIKDEIEGIDFDYIPIITEFDVKVGKAMNSPFSFAVAIWKRNGDVMRRYER